MILEKQKEAIILADGDVNESIGMSLDLDSAQILMQMLSKNLYSDSIGSTIRECASNALDSHRRIGSDDPIIVGFKMNDSYDYEFTVEDFGIGLDDDDVRNIISKYGKSTKRNSTSELGMMGLGFKAPLAYSSSFYFVCRKDGIERKYMMYEGEDVNTIDLLYEVATSERNGVKIIVPVRWADADSFYKKIAEQLAYFENVYFDVIYGSQTINNDFKIYRNDSFQYSELSKDSTLHLCLDNVYYPLDFAKLGLGSMEFPIALRFSLTDGIYPTPNREAIRYTLEAKEMIKTRISEMADFFVNKYNELSKSCENFNDVYEYYTTNKRMVQLIDNVSLNVGYISIFSNVQINKPKLKDVKHLNLKGIVDNYSYLLSEYIVTMVLNRGKIKDVKSSSYEADVNMNRFSNNNFFFYSDRIPEVKKSYFRSTSVNTYTNHYFIRKYRNFKLFPNKMGSDMRNYYNLLGLSKIKRENWREAIVEFQSIVNSIVSKWKSVDDFTVPQHFVDLHKKKSSKSIAVRKERDKGEDIIVKHAIDRETFSATRNCKFDSQVWRLKDILTMKKLVIYGHHDISVTSLDRLYSVVNKNKVSIISLSAREMKILSECEFSNVMSYDEFMKGQCGAFRRIVTAYLINSLEREYPYVFKKTDILISISKDLANTAEMLRKYRMSNYQNVGNHELYKAMVDVAEIKKLYDDPIHTKYLKFKKELESIPDVNYLFEILTCRSYDEYSKKSCNNVGVSYFKYHKKKVNLEHYKKSEKV